MHNRMKKNFTIKFTYVYRYAENAYVLGTGKARYALPFLYIESYILFYAHSP